MVTFVEEWRSKDIRSHICSEGRMDGGKPVGSCWTGFRSKYVNELKWPRPKANGLRSSVC